MCYRPLRRQATPVGLGQPDRPFFFRILPARIGRVWEQGMIGRIVLTVLIAAWAFAAHAEKRVALVLSAERYEHLRPLANPGNDARAVGEALEALGFEVVAESDRNLKRMRRAL